MCGSCQAARHGAVCWAAGTWQKRLERRQGKDVAQLTSVKLKVEDEARNSDFTMWKALFHDWYDIPLDLAWPDFLSTIERLGGNLLEVSRRHRARLQNDEGLFPACQEVQAERAAKAHVTTRYFQEQKAEA